MKHPTRDDLTLYHYGDVADRQAVARHLEACDACRAEYAALRATLDLVDEATPPRRDADYGSQVWARLEPRLRPSVRPFWREWLRGPRLALAASLATLIVVAFLAGRWTGNGVGEPISEQARERILLVAVGDHLERSQRLLAALVNTELRPQLDLGAERERARGLVNGNRIYRKTASGSGEEQIAELLDELERVLLELANGPSDRTAAEFLELRRRIESRGLLLRIEVIGRGTRARTERPLAPRTEI